MSIESSLTSPTYLPIYLPTSNDLSGFMSIESGLHSGDGGGGVGVAGEGHHLDSEIVLDIYIEREDRKWGGRKEDQ